MVVESANQSLLQLPNPSKFNTKKRKTRYKKTLHSQINYELTPITKKPFTIFHQNIRGLRNKITKLFDSILPHLPHVLCITEHHAKDQELDTLNIDQYALGAKFCRQKLKQGGTGIFVHESLAFMNIDIQKSCLEQDIEACAVKVNLQSTVVYIMCIYRAPTGNLGHFLKGLDSILKQLNKTINEIIICGDINIDYLEDNCYKRQQLDALLASFNLISTVHFLTRALNGAISAIDNIFMDITNKNKYSINPLINGLSDHDGQLIQLNNIRMNTQINDNRSTRNFNKSNIQDFQSKLSYETWDTIFGENDVDKIFNNFHDNFLRIFYSSFPKIKIQSKENKIGWMTKGIKISIKQKRELYLNSRDSKNPKSN